MIISSFSKQYNIRLLQEDLSVREYRSLLTGIMDDTPLGYVVSIRAETDSKKIKEMTANEKAIRREWQKFRANQTKNSLETASLKQFQNIMKSMAGG